MTDNEREAQSKLSRPIPTGPEPLPAPEPTPEPTPEQAPAADTQSKAGVAPLKFGTLPGPVVAPAPAATAPSAASPAAPASAPATPEPGAATPAPEADDDESAEDDDYADDDEFADDEPDIPVTWRDRIRHLSPALVTMAVASIGSAIFLAFAVTSHTTPVPVLASAAVVTGLVFALDSVVSAVISTRAAMAGESGRSLFFALVFGVSIVGCAGAFAVLAIMFLTLGTVAADLSGRIAC